MLRQTGASSCRSVACGEDFTVILTWEGQVVDSRACLTNNAPHRHGGRTLAPLKKWPFPQHPVIAVAAGGAWSGMPLVAAPDGTA